MKVAICIYKITSPTGRIYIGKTINFRKRIFSYRSWLAKGQAALHNSFLKHGFESHRFDIIQEAPANELALLEIIYIAKYNSAKNGLNIHSGGKGGDNIQTSPNRDKIIAKLKDRKGAKNPNYGNHFKHSKEARENMLKNQPNRANSNGSTAIKIRCLSTGKVYGCQKEAGIEFGLSKHLMTSIMRKRNGEYKGLKFEYAL